MQIDIVTARTLAHLARVSSLREKKDFAIQIYERILRIHQALPAPLSYDHAIALSELAAFREESGSQEEADILHRRADGIIDELSSRVNKNGERESSDDTSNESSDEDGDETESSSSEGSEDDQTTAGPPTASEETSVANA